MLLEKMGLQEIEKTGEELPEDAIEVALKSVEAYQPALIVAAASARGRGVSWRPQPFRIGCAILALNKDLDLSELQMFTGANYKPNQGEQHEWPERKCSEMVAIEEALKAGVKFIPAIVTVSSEKSTLEFGTEMHDVVHPCKRCRDFFKELIKRGIMSPKTKLVSIRDNGIGKVEQKEERGLNELLELYQTTR
jgi:cytidine deaminase